MEYFILGFVIGAALAYNKDALRLAYDRAAARLRNKSGGGPGEEKPKSGGGPGEEKK